MLLYVYLGIYHSITVEWSFGHTAIVFGQYDRLSVRRKFDYANIRSC